MKILFYCPLWGSEHLPFDEFLEKVTDAGYDGVEMSFPMDEEERDSRSEKVRAARLELIAQHWETSDSSYSDHLIKFEKKIRSLAKTRPTLINSQTGKDYFSFEQNQTLFQVADTISQETNIPILHETHRGKWSFAAHITHQYLKRFPNLKITLDISHWCVTAESLLDDQKEAVDAAIQATEHIHARVGHQEGPQVPDPRIKTWQPALDKHLTWWDTIIEHQRKNGKETFGITPEFGAPHYTILNPQTGEPLSNQWDVNVWMRDLLKERYGLV